MDANATSPLRSGAVRAVREFVAKLGGANPSSVHRRGREARAALRAARERVEEYLGGNGRAVFCSGGTEACNAVVRSFGGSKTVASAIEHQAVLQACAREERHGAELTLVAPDSTGRVDVETFVNSVDSKTSLVCLMAANNVTGAVQPVGEISEALRSKGFGGVIFSDCSQLVGKHERSVSELFNSGVDVVCFSGHKLGATPGIGVLSFSRQSERCLVFDPLLVGGAQEDGYRSGTENLLGVLTLQRVLEELSEEEIRQTRELRDELVHHLRSIDGFRLFTPQGERALSNTIACAFEDTRSDDLVVALDLAGIEVSTGSACGSGKQEVSHVFRAMGLEERLQRAAIRISLPWDFERDSIQIVCDRFREVLLSQRAGSRNLRVSTGAEQRF